MPHRAHHQVNVLHRVADAYGEDQERHQDRVWVQTETEKVQQAKLTSHGEQASHHGYCGTAPAAAIEIEHQANQADCDSEEQRDVGGSGQQITDDLGEADHADIHALYTEMLAHLLFQRLGKGTVVQRLAGLWVHLQQWHPDHPLSDPNDRVKLQ